jgi:uroporphyrinogen III methyltransferase / synthase
VKSRPGFRAKGRPLSGLRVLYTRERPDSDLTDRLRKAGAQALFLPCIEIKPLLGGGRAFLKNPGLYTWAVLSSQRGATIFAERLRDAGLNARKITGVHLACVGPSTKAELLGRGYRPELLPNKSTQEGLSNAFQKFDLKGKRVLLARARESRDVLEKALRARGAKVDLWDLYRTVVPKDSKRKALRLFGRQGGADVVVFASSLAVKNFYSFFTPAQKKKWLKRLTVASIGPVTTRTVKKIGFGVAVEPEQATLSALVEALKQWAKTKGVINHR